MQSHDMACHTGPGRLGRFKTFAGTPRGVLTLALIVSAAAYLLFLRPAVLLAILPLGLVLACPLLHVFLHRGLGGQGHQH